MNKKQKRQDKIISFIEEKTEASASAILSFLSVDIDRKTLQRDLKELTEKLLIFKKGSGRGVIYFLSESYKILKEIDTEKYSKLVIERILNYGNTSSVIWLLNHYNIETMKKNVINNKQILPKTKKYWELILNE